MDPVVHFEMPFEDQKRLSAFYKSAFGWKMQGMGPEMGDYVLAATGDSGPDGKPRTPGVINGGFFPKTGEAADSVPSVVVSVANIAKAMEKIAKAGGTVHGEPMDIPGIGKFVVFSDTEGNRASVMQFAPPPKAKAKAKKPAKKKSAKKKKK